MVAAYRTIGKDGHKVASADPNPRHSEVASRRACSDNLDPAARGFDTIYQMNADNAVESVTDALGAVTTYDFDDCYNKAHTMVSASST